MTLKDLISQHREVSSSGRSVPVAASTPNTLVNVSTRSDENAFPEQATMRLTVKAPWFPLPRHIARYPYREDFIVRVERAPSDDADADEACLLPSSASTSSVVLVEEKVDAQFRNAVYPSIDAIDEAVYVYVEEPITSSNEQDHYVDTIAKLLFLGGFFFPLFWLIGSYILIADLHMDVEVDLEGGARSEEIVKAARKVAAIRIVEVYWATLCLLAFLTFCSLVTIAACLFFGGPVSLHM